LQGKLATQSHTRSTGFYLAFELQAFDGDELGRGEFGVVLLFRFAGVADEGLVLLGGEEDGVGVVAEDGVEVFGGDPEFLAGGFG